MEREGIMPLAKAEARRVQVVEEETKVPEQYTAAAAEVEDT